MTLPSNFWLEFIISFSNVFYALIGLWIGSNQNPNTFVIGGRNLLPNMFQLAIAAIIVLAGVTLSMHYHAGNYGGVCGTLAMWLVTIGVMLWLYFRRR